MTIYEMNRKENWVKIYNSPPQTYEYAWWVQTAAAKGLTNDQLADALNNT